MISKNAALLLVDLQNDFFPKGALPVKEANQIFPLANELQLNFKWVIASKDWHPNNHKSFASQHPGQNVFDVINLNGLPQVLWPDHCVQNTQGAEFHPKLETSRIQKIIFKGSDPEIDSYSAFFDNAHLKDTGLHAFLQSEQIQDLYIMGLATDYCVLFTVLDARKLGYNTWVIEDGCFGIEKKQGDIKNAKTKMHEAGAILVQSSDLS